MINRLLMALMFMPIAFAGFAAQLTATLQSGDKVTPFYGKDAFKQAHEAAADGDIITLSEGQFTAVDVTKSVTVTGVYAFTADASKMTEFTVMTVSADNVTFEGIRFSGSLTIDGADNLTLSRCYFTTLSDGDGADRAYHNNTVITDCLINGFEAMSHSSNAVLRNCCVNFFSDCNTAENIALIENCNIANFYYFFYSGTFSYKYYQPYAIYRNCFLGLYAYTSNSYPTINLYSPSEFHDVIIHQSYWYFTSSADFREWKINFNSCLVSGKKESNSYGIGSANSDSLRWGSFENSIIDGVTYGPSDHKAYPSLPAITSAEIDKETDADGKLHVKITAVARD